MDFDLTYRPRRIRSRKHLRDMFAETSISVDNLIQPLFAVNGDGVRKEIPSMPGQYHLSVDEIVKECRELDELGIRAVLLFGTGEKTDPEGKTALDPNGVVPRAVTEIKNAGIRATVITDVCLCAYTSHGHCGVLSHDREQAVDNDATVEILGEMAVVHARAGADVVAPSDMMDGRVGAIRQSLDQAGFENTCIMSYAAKYASAFYGPFRDAAGSAPDFGDRSGYQMDPRNIREALLEVELDMSEGADIVIVKPGLPNLDVIHAVRSEINAPLAAYMVSGEYAMIKAAAAQNWLEERKAVTEALLAFRRAGAHAVITYFAKDFARWQRT